MTPELFTLFSAWLFSLLTQSPSIRTLAKTASQRSDLEQAQVKQGLLRESLLEFFLFVPASVLMALWIGPPTILHLFPALAKTIGSSGDLKNAFYAGLGIASYHFPYDGLRLILVNIIKTIIEKAYHQMNQTSTSTSASIPTYKVERADE